MGIKRKRTSEAYDRLQNINSLPDLLCTNSTEFLVLNKLLSVAIESFSRSLSFSDAKEPVHSRKESLDRALVTLKRRAGVDLGCLGGIPVSYQ
ncbi:hypothetical protein TNCV_4846431 [Trichonephila clavipes]|uniref:Uncharacterized protein n=1 Tax=Trichonephila clavipes TaxID=2585209 RepID=A0A8X7BLD3_TRICX|nr:hypothetical protein TNCV_4846431 [Trichonephila clavipes]